MNKTELDKINAFFAQCDENGVSNGEKAEKNSKVIRRIATTDKSRSFEETEKKESEYPTGVVVEDGKLIGLGIHIFNEDVYPIQSFEIYLRDCSLTGHLDVSSCRDMVFLDLYRNGIESADVRDMPDLRILGLQSNRIEELDVTELPACQGIDVGKNRLKSLDVSRNSELVELYINDNGFEEIDISQNAKLKYFYCHNNRISRLDTTANPLLRHVDATGNPMREIKSLAPQREKRLPLEVYASEGGFVGLKFYPVYNAQWKETGEWQQRYEAYPADGFAFDGWYEKDEKVSGEEKWTDGYGASRVLTARFEKK